MSQAIDLTADADSPPRPAPPALTLPVGRGTPSGPAGGTGSNATASSSAAPSGPPPSFLDTVIGSSGNRSNAGTSGGASSSSRRPGGSSSSSSTARPGAILSRRDRDFLNEWNGSSSSSAARRNRAPLPNRRRPSNSSSLPDGAGTTASAPGGRRPMVRDPTDDGFELTGMSEGARQAAERARREAEESQRWRQDFLSANARSTPGSYGAGPSQGTRNQTGHAPATRSIYTGRTDDPDWERMLRVHETVAPGPHRPAPARHRGPWAALPGQDGDFFGGLFNFADGRGLDLHNLTNLLRVHPQGPARGGAAARGGHRPRQSPHLALQIPTKHDFKMVLNHRERPVKVGFSFGIIEPPLDVETYEEDPRIIRGALPDTSPICAGCDCALVLGGEGKKRMWALPCGHVVDGRCYERYRAGVNAKTARELAHGEVEREKREQQHTRITDLLAGAKRSHPDEADSSATEDEDVLPPPSARLATGPEGLDPKGKDRAISPSLPSSAVIVGEGSASSTSRALRHRAMQQSESSAATTPQLSPKTVSKSSSSHKGQTSEAAESERQVATFTCPVDGCSQRISTSPNKPSSAIELYI